MRILIFGAGSIGSIIGGFLAHKGHEVCLVGREPHMKAVADAGLRISGIWGERCVKEIHTRTSLEGLNDSYDAVLLTVKSYDTVDAVRALKQLALRSPLFISFQNGLGNVEVLEREFGKEKTGGARVIFGARIVKPGHVEVTVCADKVALGPLWKPVSRRHRTLLENFANVLDEAGIPCFYTDNVIVFLWSKVLYNAPLNPLSALLRVPYGELLRDESLRMVMRQIIREGYAVARSELGSFVPWKSAEEYIKLFEEELVPNTAEHYASMCEDLWKRGRTEIGTINGEIVRRGIERGVVCPSNFLLTHLITALSEKAEKNIFESATKGKSPMR